MHRPQINHEVEVFTFMSYRSKVKKVPGLKDKDEVFAICVKFPYKVTKFSYKFVCIGS